MSTPAVTVLMAVHNGARFLRASIESVLQQSYHDFEFLIVDDASTDGSLEIIESFADARVRLIRNSVNIGLTRSLNVGLNEARGELIARQDADDISHADRLERQVAFLSAHPEVALVGVQARAIGEAGRPLALSSWPKAESELGIRWQLMFDSPFVHSAVMFRKAVVLDELRGYDEDFRTSQDFELWSRVAEHHGVRNLPDVLLDFRVSSDSLSRNYSEENITRIRAVLRRNMCRYLDLPNVSEDWLDLWIRVNNPRVYGRVADSSGLSGALRSMYARFLDVHPAARGEPHIRRHIASSVARVAWSVARYDRRSLLINCFGACRVDLAATLMVLGNLGRAKLAHRLRAA